jgi:hypothetical protein
LWDSSGANKAWAGMLITLSTGCCFLQHHTGMILGGKMTVAAELVDLLAHEKWTSEISFFQYNTLS